MKCNETNILIDIVATIPDANYNRKVPKNVKICINKKNSLTTLLHF